MVEGARLESEYAAKPYRGFESLPLRHTVRVIDNWDTTCRENGAVLRLFSAVAVLGEGAAEHEYPEICPPFSAAASPGTVSLNWCILEAASSHVGH